MVEADLLDGVYYLMIARLTNLMQGLTTLSGVLIHWMLFITSYNILTNDLSEINLCLEGIYLPHTLLRSLPVTSNQQLVSGCDNVGGGVDGEKTCKE